MILWARWSINLIDYISKYPKEFVWGSWELSQRIEPSLFICLYFWFLFKLKINISLSLFHFSPLNGDSQDKGVYIPTIFPSLTWNKVNVGPLLSHNSWNVENLSPFSDNLYKSSAFFFEGFIQFLMLHYIFHFHLLFYYLNYLSIFFPSMTIKYLTFHLIQKFLFLNLNFHFLIEFHFLLTH